MPFRNRLLTMMNDEDRAKLAPHMVEAQLGARETFFRHGDVIESVFFPESGVIALSPANRHCDVALIGPEGLLGIPLVMGIDRTCVDAQFITASAGHRVEADSFNAVVSGSAGLRDLLSRYYHCVILQIASTASSNLVLPVDKRLARWLLMVHDRARLDELHVTHSELATSLGVQRPGVTNALQLLESDGAILCKGSAIRICDRDVLRERAGESYGEFEAEYERLVAPDAPADVLRQ